jgi:hypothetical protein
MQIQIPNTEELERESKEIIVSAQQMVVVTHDDYLSAGEELKRIKRGITKIQDSFKESKELAHKAHKAITTLEKKLLEPLENISRICSQKVSAYLIEEKKKEQAEAARRLKEAEEAAKIETERIKKEQDEERLRAAEQLSAQGFIEEADEVLAQEVVPVPVAPVYIAPVQQAERVQGVNLRITYKAEVTNFMLLVQEVASGRQPISYLLPNESVLNKQATALKEELRIPGVRVIQNVNTQTRGGY